MKSNNTNINGLYTFLITIPTMFKVYQIKTNYHNLITNYGENFFIDKWINNGNNEVINNIVIGDGTTNPTKRDTSLENQTNILDTTISTENRNVIMQTELNGAEINNTTEIGVITSEGNLLSRDVHEPIQVPYNSNITIKYMYSVDTGVYKSGWNPNQDFNNTYTINETEEVFLVHETDTGSGYIKKDTIIEVNSTPASYYYDRENNLLHIHTSDDANPDAHDILIEHGGT